MIAYIYLKVQSDMVQARQGRLYMFDPEMFSGYGKEITKKVRGKQ